MRRCAIAVIWVMVMALSWACSNEREHTALAIDPRDSVSMMTSYGVNTLISDSGVIKYRIVAEKWEVNTVRHPSRWIFEKGLFLEQFNQSLHVQSYIQCDTAYYYDTERKWELRGRVRILTKNGLRFSSEELFWDENRHELWSNKFSHFVTKERELQGSYFRSDEKMTKYYVSNSKGSFEKGDVDKQNSKPAVSQNGDSARVQYGRGPASPGRKRTQATTE